MLLILESVSLFISSTDGERKDNTEDFLEFETE